MFTQHWFNRASHLHILSHSFSTTLLVVTCWQCCLSRVIVPLSHVVAPAVAFPAISVLYLLVWNSSSYWERQCIVINDKCEGERQWKIQKNHYLLNSHLRLTLLSKQFPSQPSWSMKVSDNDNCDTAITAPGPLTGTSTTPIWWCIWTDICTYFHLFQWLFPRGIHIMVP